MFLALFSVGQKERIISNLNTARVIKHKYGAYKWSVVESLSKAETRAWLSHKTSYFCERTENNFLSFVITAGRATPCF